MTQSQRYALLRSTSCEWSVCVPGSLLNLGRHSSNDLVIDHTEVSRHHARVVWEERAEFPAVVDLGSANGTRVDQRLVPPNEPYPLRKGGAVAVSNVVLTFELHDLSRAEEALAKPGKAVEGDLQHSSLIELLGLLELHSRSGTLLLDLEQGTARLVLSQGTIVSASAGDAEGEDAVRLLVGSPQRGTFTFERGHVSQPRCMNLSFSEFLLRFAAPTCAGGAASSYPTSRRIA
jgi:pSer/pThr/pTyr-binding forkhead associated (FHA) protein